jgi:SAM-dependent methyltransferase
VPSTDLAGTKDGFPERFDPATMGGELVEAEHMCRYWWAAGLAAGRRVLDAGCGTGYGSSVLARAGAREVVGVDRAAEVLEAASAGAHSGVRFERADLASLPFEDGSFDLVVSFEAIEHVEDQERVLDELVRVLAGGGVLAISSPNRDVYVPGNPHHTHEYLPEELRDALAARLANVRLVRQRNWLASTLMEDGELASTDGEPLAGMLVRKLIGYDAGSEIFTVALASDAELPRPAPLTALTHVDELRKWVEWNAHVEGVLRDAERQLAVIPVATAQIEAGEREREQLRAELAGARSRQAELERQLSTLSRSLSWRVTAPLRAGAGLARDLAARRRGAR